MDNTTLHLFGRTPTEVGDPIRRVVHNVSEIQNFIDRFNGQRNCYVSLYPSNFIIDKIFFDFDYGDYILDDTKAVFSHLTNKNYKVIPLTTGIKPGNVHPRYHLYLELEPHIYGPTAKPLLYGATLNILESVFGPVHEKLTTLPNGKQKRILYNSERIVAPDPSCIGDIRRLTRIPNTLRPPSNNSYCTYIPSDKFLSMTESDIIKHTKAKHHYTYPLDGHKLPLLTDFPFDLDTYLERNKKTIREVDDDSGLVTSNPSLFLKNILRPCVYKNLIIQHPAHIIRVIATIDLLNLGYPASTILSLYSTLGWEDFEEQTTSNYINWCTKYKPYSCTKLRSLGIPKACCIG